MTVSACWRPFGRRAWERAFEQHGLAGLRRHAPSTISRSAAHARAADPRLSGRSPRADRLPAEPSRGGLQDWRLAEKIGDQRQHDADRPPPAELTQQPESEPAIERLPQALAPHQEHDDDRASETEDA